MSPEYTVACVVTCEDCGQTIWEGDLSDVPIEASADTDNHEREEHEEEGEGE